MIVKICGLRRAEDLSLAANLGADVVGVILGVPESPRNNSLEEARKLFSVDLKGKTQRALLFRSSPLEFVMDTMEKLLPEVVHLCGSEDSRYRGKLKEKFPNIVLWQSVGVPVDSPADEDWVFRTRDLFLEESVDQVVLDSAKGGKTGGVGKAFPLERVHSEFEEESSRLVLAGGITADNVVERVKTFNPYGVDVSSGVESEPGIKDPELVRALFDTLRREI